MEKRANYLRDGFVIGKPVPIFVVSIALPKESLVQVVGIRCFRSLENF